MKRTKHFLDVAKVTGHTGLTTWLVTLDGRVVDEFCSRTEAGEMMNKLKRQLGV